MGRKKSVVSTEPSAEELALRQQVATLSLQQQALLQQLAAARPQQSVMGTAGMQLMVGIRNISNYTVGIASPFPGEPELHLHPVVAGREDPNTVAAISFAWWQQLRKSKHVANGIIMRDDSVLGSYHNAAPADRPEEVAAGAERNIVLDPFEWIESKSEAELRRAIAAMTSEQSLRRLLAAVNARVEQIRSGIPDPTVPWAPNQPNPEYEAKETQAVDELPGIYQLTERLAEAKLDTFAPPDRA